MYDNRKNSMKLKIKFVSLVVVLLLNTIGCVNNDLSDNMENSENMNIITDDNNIEIPVGDKNAEATKGSADNQKTEESNKHGKGSFQTEKQSTEEQVSISMLSEEQRNLIIAFMDDYYETLATLEVINPSTYFVDPEGRNSVLNQVVWSFMVKLRGKQSIDLLMDQYEYILTLESVETEEEDVEITLTEDSIQTYKAYPNVTSEQYNTIHHFVLNNTDNGWRIESHRQRGTLYWNLLGDYHERRDEEEDIIIDEQEAIESIYTQMNVLLEKADSNFMLRQETIEKVELPEYDYEYNRTAAIEYANSWIDERNETWLDYSSYGGNCQNFASQILLAGGIPMDLKGSELWKWYSTNLNDNTSSTGRTSSWTGVDNFLEYASENRGYGLVSDTNAPYYSGEIGDLIIMGYDENWRHTVVISEVIKDERGNTIDYLINSNTSDLRNFPVGAYIYTRQKLVKIYGWNE